MSELGIPYAAVNPETGERECPLCGAGFAEDHDAAGELTSDNYGQHYAQWHAGETQPAWCETCGNPVENGKCACWCHLADALQRYLGMDFDGSAQIAARLWEQEADKARVWSAEYASDHDVPTYPRPVSSYADEIVSYADEIMARIHEDMAREIVPFNVGSFSALHDCRDANMYVLSAMGEADTYEAEEADTYEAEAETDEHNALVNLIMDLVSERLAAEAQQIEQDRRDHPHDDPCPRCGRRQWTDEHAQETCQACGYAYSEE